VNQELSRKKYHFILGHSQGSILLSALMTSNSWKGKPIGYILNGCAWPNPFSSDLKEFKFDKGIYDIEPKVLFVIGDRDKINPPEGAIRVREALMKGGMSHVATCNHPGGHSVPVSHTESLTQMTDWVIDLVDSEAVAKVL